MSGPHDEIGAALEAWIRELAPEYEHFLHEASPSPPVPPGALVELMRIDDGIDPGGDARFPGRGVQQITLAVYTFEILLVRNAAEDGCDSKLKSLTEAMRGSIAFDATLGGRVPITSRQFTAEFDTPLIEWEDGTRLRSALVTMLVANPEKETW